MFHAANLLLLMLKTHGGLYNSSGLFKSRKKKKKKTLITAAVGFICDMTTLRETYSAVPAVDVDASELYHTTR